MSSSKNEVSGEVSLPAFVDRVAQLLPRLCRAMVRSESNAVTRGDLTLPQFWALEILRAEGPRQMHELTAPLQLKASTGTVFVDRLVGLGLVRRSRAQADRRVVQVALTAKGNRVVDEIHRQRRHGLLDLYKPLDGGERANYLSMLEKLERELNQSCTSNP